MAGALQVQHVHQADHAGLRRAIVGLAEISVHAGGGRGHEDAPVALLAHDGPHGARAIRGAQQVHVHDGVEVFGAHLGESLVAQDAGVVDQDVDAAPCVHRPAGHGRDIGTVAHAAAIGDCLAAGRGDLVGHGLGRAAKIIHHHPAAARGQLQRVAAAQPLSGACHDGDAFVKAYGHGGHP
ncbi:hypothetical protein D3C72_1227070 [compost metagenome]